MALEHVFILCAGYGTRMGEIGKILPKLLWPVFEKKMLELQVMYARSLGAKRIYINSHFLHEQIVEFVNEKKWSDVVLVYEPQLLDVGGGICNVANFPELQNVDQLLILNGDQFYLFDQDFLKKSAQEMGEAHALLFGITVDAGKGYNATIIENGKLVRIEGPAGKTEPYQTYSGVSIINLKKLNKLAGPSKFFDTVAPFKVAPVLMRTPPQAEYWDFGTIERYFHSTFRLLQVLASGEKSRFLEFCLQSGVLAQEKIFLEQNAYGQKRFKNTVKLGEGDILNYESFASIMLGDEGGVSVEGKGIFYQGIYEPLP